MTTLSYRRSATGPRRRAGWTTARIVCTLAGVGYDTVRGITRHRVTYTRHGGGLLTLAAGSTLIAVSARHAAGHRTEATANDR
jgi:hypothetical protein